MKRIIFTSLAALALGSTQAAYTIKINMEDKIKFYEWVSNDPILGDWENTGSIYACSDWSPEPSSITVNQAFTQIATDCKQNQTRTVQDREVDQVSGIIRDSGEPYTNTQQITAMSSREELGTKETWVTTSSTNTAWVNSGALTSCTNWTPAISTVDKGQSFTQTATDCEQPQTRSRQEREQETTTSAIRNIGMAITENQSITASSTRAATGTKPVLNCQFDGSNYYWAFSSGSWAFWGELVLFSASNAQTSVVFNGVTYTRGALQYISGGTDYYFAICK